MSTNMVVTGIAGRADLRDTSLVWAGEKEGPNLPEGSDLGGVGGW